MTPTYQQLCLATCEIACLAGKFMAKERISFDASKIEIKGLHDLVSYVDKESEKQIITALQKLLPESGFIAEEGTNNKKGERFNWVIDPLDGTTNYIQGIPLYAVSIGLLEGDELVLGVVYEVGRGECFYAWKDSPAYLNGEEIHVSKTTTVTDSLLGTGFPYSNFKNIDKYLDLLKWAMSEARGVRRMGSAATDLAYVACGRFDAFFESHLKPWDVAAGSLIVKQAGGVISDFSAGDQFLFGGEIIASNGFITQVMQDKVAELLK